jgi:hypothetical protein
LQLFSKVLHFYELILRLQISLLQLLSLPVSLLLPLFIILPELFIPLHLPLASPFRLFQQLLRLFSIFPLLL